MPNSILSQRAQEMEPIYRDYILSGDISTISAEFSQAHNLNENSATALENGIFLFMLFFINKSDFVKFIVENCNLSTDEARILIDAITLSIPAYIRALQQKGSMLVFAEDINSDIAEASISNLESKSPTLNPSQFIPSPETTYTSTQSAILNENRTQNQSQASTPDTNRWGTDQQ